ILKKTRHEYEGALIIVDGVFSISGRVTDLPGLAALAKKYFCRLYVDDAHALGVLGPQGQGTESHFGVTGVADIVMGTFSKSFASIGGFIAGSADVVHYVKHTARPFIFSAAMPPPAVAAVLECLKLVQEEPEHRARLWKNARRMQKELSEMGFNTMGTETPIVPLLIGEDRDAFAFAQRLYERGVFATPVIAPAVPKGSALIRTSYMATHTDDELDFALEILEQTGREFGILGSQGLRAQISVREAVLSGAG
ncbi:MAG: aminotransferase class I/II-fold pyridoxal phosphate-dependent enzyme, partial [Bdellovibrionota bacterium]